jgi:hypothetical protein
VVFLRMNWESDPIPLLPSSAVNHRADGRILPEQPKEFPRRLRLGPPAGLAWTGSHSSAGPVNDRLNPDPRITIRAAIIRQCKADREDSGKREKTRGKAGRKGMPFYGEGPAFPAGVFMFQWKAS